MTNSIPATLQADDVSMRRAPLVVSALLLSAAAILPHWQGLHVLGFNGDIEAVSTGRILLTAGALPWLLQWAGLAVLLHLACRRWCPGNRAPFVLACSISLLAASSWWAPLIVRFWDADPLQLLVDELMRWVVHEPGAAAIGDHLLWDVAGPLVCPLKCQGPHILSGWDFVWTGLSTALVLVFWACAMVWMKVDLSLRGQTSRRQFRQAILVCLVYFLPVYIHALSRLSEIWRTMGPI